MPISRAIRRSCLRRQRPAWRSSSARVAWRATTESVSVAGCTKNSALSKTIGKRQEATLSTRVASCRFPIVFDNAEFLVHPATDTDSVVARHATRADELLQAGLCRRRQDLLIAREIGIEG